MRGTGRSEPVRDRAGDGLAHRFFLFGCAGQLGKLSATSTRPNQKESTMRMLHTMLRVGDLQRAIDFYTQVLEMKPVSYTHLTLPTTPYV